MSQTPNAKTVDANIMEKLAQVEQQLVGEIYVPAFIDEFNKQAAAVGIEGITTAAAAERAIQLSQWVQANKPQVEKQAHHIAGTGNSALDAVFAKLASLEQPTYTPSQGLRQVYAELVAQLS